MVGKSVLKLSKTDVVRSHGHLSSAFPPAVGHQNKIIKYVSVGQMTRFLYQQIALDVLFQMRYVNLPNSNKQPSDSLKAEATPVFTSKQDCFAYCLAH